MNMARFMQMFLNEGKAGDIRFLDSGIIAGMTAIQDQDYPGGIGYRGLGWFVSDYYGHKSVWHYGDMYPCISGSLILPEAGVGVVLFANTYKAIPTAIRLINTTVDELLRIRGEEKQEKTNPKFRKVSIGEDGKRYAGIFATPIGVLEVTPKNKKRFRVEFWEEGKTLSGVLYEDGALVLRKFGFNILTLELREVEGEEILFYREKGRLNLAGKRIGGPKISGPWKQVAGTYRVKDFAGGYEFLTSFRIYEKKGLLIGEGTTIYPTIPRFQIVLRPVNDHQAIIEGVGGEGLLGETVPLKTGNGQVELRLAGYDLEAIR